MAIPREKLFNVARKGAELSFTTGAAFLALQQWFVMGAGLENFVGLERPPFTIEDLPAIVALNLGAFGVETAIRKGISAFTNNGNAENISTDLEAATTAPQHEIGLSEEI